MKRKSCKVRYTTEAAFKYATKHVEHLSFKNPKDRCLKAMDGKKIKVVIKIYEVEDDS